MDESDADVVVGAALFEDVMIVEDEYDSDDNAVTVVGSDVAEGRNVAVGITGCVPEDSAIFVSGNEVAERASTA